MGGPVSALEGGPQRLVQVADGTRIRLPKGVSPIRKNDKSQSRLVQTAERPDIPYSWPTGGAGGWSEGKDAEALTRAPSVTMIGGNAQLARRAGTRELRSVAYATVLAGSFRRLNSALLLPLLPIRECRSNEIQIRVALDSLPNAFDSVRCKQFL